MSDNEPLVSIMCFSYNHVSYIDDCIQGFLNQKTTFKFEVLVHDDASTDGTTEKLLEYQKEYPEIVHLYLEETNQYSQKKQVLYSEISSNIKGKYVAYCEGDDFWIDNNKLQMQVEYMENNPDVSLTATNCLILDCRNGKLTGMNGFQREQDVSLKELLIHKNNCFQAGSYVMRKNIFFVPDYYRECQTWDWTCQLYAGIKGRVHYFDRICHVYRYQSSENAWTSMTSGYNYISTVNYIIHVAWLTRFFKRFNSDTQNVYSDIICPIINGLYSNAASLILDNGISDMVDLKKDIEENAVVDIEENWNDIVEVLYEVKQIRSDIIEFVKKYKSIYIYGTGPLSADLIRFFKIEKIDFKGFVVSDGQRLKAIYRDKPVYVLKDIPDKQGEYGIVISVRRLLREEIERTLTKKEQKDYIWAWM